MINAAFVLGFIDEMEKMAAVEKDIIHGGIADKKRFKDFPPAKLRAGAKVEMEHTDKKDVAKEIASDHLSEDMNYYEKLRKMEGGGKKKEAAFLSNVGNAIKHTGLWIGGHGVDVGRQAQLTVKALAHPLRSTIEGARFTGRQAMSGGTLGRAVNLGALGLQGVGVAQDLKSIRKEQDPTGMGRGRGERVGQMVGATAGGLIGAPYKMTGSIIASEAGRRGLGLVGRGADRVIAKVKGRKALKTKDPSLTDLNAKPATRLIGTVAPMLGAQ
jgi:hypothetical protein